MGSNTVTPETDDGARDAYAAAAVTPRARRKAAVDAEDSLEVLVGRVSAGDRAAFRAVYDQTARFVFSVILRIVRNREIAEEVAQECYVLLWQRADRYQTSRGKALTWIASIARYRAIDRIRSDRARGVDTAVSVQPCDADLQNRITQSDKPCCTRLSDTDRSLVDSMSLCSVLKRLKPEQQRAILLSYRYGYTHEELAQTMGVPLGTVKSWVRRGLRSLKDSLES